MRTLTDRASEGFIRLPRAPYRTMSVWAMVTASTVALISTAQLFVDILAGEVVRVPRMAGLELTVGTALLALGAWAIGTLAHAIPAWRAPLGWLLPVGAVMSAMLDSHTFAGTIIYLVTLASAMHWWSAVLERRPETAHMWGVPLRVLQTQISIVYLWTAYAKLNPRFLSGAVLSVSFHGPVPVPDFVMDRQVLMAMAVVTIVAEVFFAAALWIDTLRPWALAGVAAFHLFIMLFFAPTLPLVAFSLVMTSGYLLFAGEPWERTLDPPAGSPARLGQSR